MAAAKTTTAPLKEEAPLVLTRIHKRVAPYMLYAVTGFFHNAAKAVYMFPLTAEMSGYLSEMEHTDPSSAEYAGLVEETRHKAREVLIISTAIALVTLTLAFAKQIVAIFFVASSTTTHSSSSGNHSSLVELLREVTKWPDLRSSLVTTAAVVTVVQFASMALLGGNLVTVMRDSGLLSMGGSLFLAAFLAFLYLGVLALPRVAMRRKEYSVMVLLTFLLPALLTPLCAVVVLYLYTEQVMGLGLSLLSVFDLLQSVQDLVYLWAVGAYYQLQLQC